MKYTRTSSHEPLRYAKCRWSITLYRDFGVDSREGMSVDDYIILLRLI